jgi:7-cyano-7-deazaguanine reductase
VARRLEAAIEPLWLHIGGYWYPRGMPIDVFYQSGAPPESLWLPDQVVAPYNGRG